ncbi:MAG: prepilin peptidase [Bacilli bacterium]|nr:prepilin peptidase [Bacilli bacterium]
MEIYYLIVLFVFGTIFGSFFAVVGTRIPNGESIVSPPSHCTECGHQLKFYELIPILSYLLQGGKCRVCKTKLSIKYLLYELATGILFSLCYLSFGYSLDLLIALTFVSIIMIILISDIEYYIIPDEVLAFGSILLLVEIASIYGLKAAFYHLIGGILAFVLMFLVKKMGDFLFKKESMGGGDIKLLFVIGLVIGFRMSIVTIFLSSFIGLPISLFVLYRKKTNIIPYGPFLGIAAIILYLLHIDFIKLLSILVA